MSKRRKEKVNLALKDRVTVKYVKRANAWCRTVFSKGQQTQTWSAEKPPE